MKGDDKGRSILIPFRGKEVVRAELRDTGGMDVGSSYNSMGGGQLGG